MFHCTAAFLESLQRDMMSPDRATRQAARQEFAALFGKYDARGVTTIHSDQALRPNRLFLSQAVEASKVGS